MPMRTYRETCKPGCAAALIVAILVSLGNARYAGAEDCHIFDNEASSGLPGLHFGYILYVGPNSMFPDLASPDTNFNDVASAASAPMGCNLHLYEHIGFSGGHWVLEGESRHGGAYDSSFLQGTQINDIISSTWCECPETRDRSVCQPLPGYAFYPDFDSPGNDIARASSPEGSVADYASECEMAAATHGSQCTGFTTTGWLKRRAQLVPLPPSKRVPTDPCLGTYIRVGAKCPQIPGFLFYSGADATFNDISKLDVKDPAKLAEHCIAAGSVCQGFNTQGFLKSSVRDLQLVASNLRRSQDICLGTYVRQ